MYAQRLTAINWWYSSDLKITSWLVLDKLLRRGDGAAIMLSDIIDLSRIKVLRLCT